MIKLDIENTFDKVDWEFLDDILKVKSFGNTWRLWIRGCISFANFLIIINGKSRGKIIATIRLGDPLSPKALRSMIHGKVFLLSFLFSIFVHCVVRNERDTYFWKDGGYDPFSLCELAFSFSMF